MNIFLGFVVGLFLFLRTWSALWFLTSGRRPPTPGVGYFIAQLAFTLMLFLLFLYYGAFGTWG